ncbi:ubiquitin carboxyl-terminal hydrolase 31-like [Dermatophagoides pteronyssinus]|uniref:ubiquitin carboxyl-terminal hydrolase 31-like n=1 Tax=Dermatophagoides pteronyssinus TaxID=6956 RepID=UPI003F67260A
MSQSINIDYSNDQQLIDDTLTEEKPLIKTRTESLKQNSKKIRNVNNETDNRTTSNSNNHQSTSTSNFTRLIRILSFRRKITKKSDHDQSEDKLSSKLDNIRGKRSHSSLPFMKRSSKNRQNSDFKPTNIAGDEASSADNSNLFIRFLRTFRFLYKRKQSSTNQSSKIKRSSSLNNPRKSKSFPENKRHHHFQIDRRKKNLSGSIDNISELSSPSRRSEPPPSSHHNDYRAQRLPKSPSKQKIIPNGNIPSRSKTPSPSQSQFIETSSTNSNECKKESPVENSIDQIDNSNNTPKIQSIDNINPNIISSSDLTCNGNGFNIDQHFVDHNDDQNDLNLHSSLVEYIPGVCGIQNHGNTCYLNSIIQCLSNTAPLAEYFCLNYYREDLVQNRSTTGGEVSECLALLIKSLWTYKYSSDISLKFKYICGKYNKQYLGHDQHDAQEFLLWLLNTCHEELSKSNSPYKSIKNGISSMLKNAPSPKKISQDKSEEKAAKEFLARCQTSNSSSIISDLFQGQLRSTIECPTCGHRSKTFDPYTSISLSVIFRFTIFIKVTFLDHTIIKYGISIEAALILRNLRDKISRMIKIPERRLLLLQEPSIHYQLVEFANDYKMCQEIFTDSETICALETPELSHQDKDGLLTIVWLNRIDETGPIFGPLFTTVVSRVIGFRKLQENILLTMAEYIIDFKNVDFVKLSHFITLRIRVVNGLKGEEYLKPSVDHPLFVKSVENALSMTENQYRGPYHLKLIVEWDLDSRQNIIVSNELFNMIAHECEDESVKKAQEHSKMNNRTTLQDCLDLYFRDENLTSENSWQCSSCSSQSCLRKLNIWSLPDILILHLKRFRYTNNMNRLKVNTMVDYPENGLDLLKYVQEKFSESFNGTMNGHDHSPSFSSLNSSNDRRSSSSSSNKLTYKCKGNDRLDETTYDLFAVSCHQGNMQSGHYKAYSKNSVDNCWYLFDDTKVTVEKFKVKQDAYILFYQKSSVSASYSMITTKCQHWAFRMPIFDYNFQNGCHQHSSLSYSNKSSTLPSQKSRMNNHSIATVNHHYSNHIDSSNKNQLHYQYSNGQYQQQKIFNDNSKKYKSENNYNINGYHSYSTNNDNNHHNQIEQSNQHHHHSHQQLNQHQAFNTFSRNKSKYAY